MSEKKGVMVAGFGAVAVGILLFATRAKAAPPEPPEPPSPPPPGLATLFGIVSRADTGEPLSGVNVSLWSPDGLEMLDATTTKGSGSFLLENILPGSYTITFQKEGYETQAK